MPYGSVGDGLVLIMKSQKKSRTARYCGFGRNIYTFKFFKNYLKWLFLLFLDRTFLRNNLEPDYVYDYDQLENSDLDFSEDEEIDENYVPDINDNSDDSDSEELKTNLFYNDTASDDDQPAEEEDERRARPSKPLETWTERRFEGTPLPETENNTLTDESCTVKSPLSYIKEYFPFSFFEKGALFSNQYSIYKTGKALNTTPEELKKLYGIHLFMGCHRLPRARMYFDRRYGISIKPDVMTRDRFFLLRTNLHFVDVSKPPENLENKLWKVQPVIDAILNVCHKIPRESKYYSFDEQMIPFTGKCVARQYVKGKPMPWGLKNYVLAASNGLLLDFIIYQGETTQFSNTELGKSAAAVMT